MYVYTFVYDPNKIHIKFVYFRDGQFIALASKLS